MKAHLSIKRLFCAVCAICMILPGVIIPARAEGESDAKVVRVGYYESEAFEQGAEEGAVKSGYAYEYYRKIAEYAGWRYEYVYGDFSVLYEQLLSGDVDLIAGMAYKEDRVGLVGYPELPMGNETVSIAKHADDDSITIDHATLRNKKIGVIYSAIYDRLQEWIKKEDIEASAVGFKDYDDMYAAFDVGEIDAYVVEGDSSSPHENSEILYAFDRDDYYMCVNINRPDILEDLNAAQNAIDINEPGYISYLKAKYYSSNNSVQGMPKEATEWLSTHNELKVGYLDDYLPFSDTSRDGSATGLVRDETEEIIRVTGYSELPVTYTGYDSYTAMTEALAAGDVDVIFPVAGGAYFAETDGLNMSSPVLTSTVGIAYKGKFTGEKFKKVAVNENINMAYYYASQLLPDAEVVYYPSTDACVKAVKRGQAGCALINGMRINDVLKDHRYNGLSIVQTSVSDETGFGVRPEEVGLLKFINQGIKLTGSEFAFDTAYTYMDSIHKSDIIDIMMQHYTITFIVWIAILAAVIVLFKKKGKKTDTTT